MQKRTDREYLSFSGKLNKCKRTGRYLYICVKLFNGFDNTVTDMSQLGKTCVNKQRWAIDSLGETTNL